VPGEHHLADGLRLQRMPSQSLVPGAAATTATRVAPFGEGVLGECDDRSHGSLPIKTRLTLEGFALRAQFPGRMAGLAVDRGDGTPKKGENGNLSGAAGACGTSSEAV
jgi:hypothetical protein